MTADELQALIDQLRERMTTMTDDQRMEVRDAVMDGYCHECGSKYLPCFCWNDD